MEMSFKLAWPRRGPNPSRASVGGKKERVRWLFFLQVITEWEC